MVACPTVTIDRLFLEDLGEAYEAERRFQRARKVMRGRATARGLQTVIGAGIAEGPERAGSLREAFGAMGARPRGVDCPGADGLVAGAALAMDGAGEESTRLDLAIASAMARIGHHEIATYRGLVAFAKAMERDDLLDLLLGPLERAEEAVARVESLHADLVRRASHEVVEG
jgi:ferritin-like metal-binding protein YciE